MTFTIRFGWVRLPILVAGFGLACGGIGSGAGVAAIPSRPGTAERTSRAAEAAPDASEADIMKGIDVSKLDWSQLKADAPPSRRWPRRRARRKRTAGTDTSWSPNARPNGSSAVSVKQSVSPFWDTRIGADMTVARQGTLTSRSNLCGESSPMAAACRNPPAPPGRR